MNTKLSGIIFLLCFLSCQGKKVIIKPYENMTEIRNKYIYISSVYAKHVNENIKFYSPVFVYVESKSETHPQDVEPKFNDDFVFLHGENYPYAANIDRVIFYNRLGIIKKSNVTVKFEELNNKKLLEYTHILDP